MELNSVDYKAWLGKGESAGWSSTLRDFRLPEMVSGIQNASAYAPDNEKLNINNKGATIINSVTIAFYSLAYKHLLEYIHVGDTWADFLNKGEFTLISLFKE